MAKKFMYVCFGVLALSCAGTTYKTMYETHLEGTDPPSLHFSDERFRFKFLPIPNGVYFNVENMTSDPAFILWDDSYFIEPCGNSAKALNTDMLEEGLTTSLKARYESILPPKASFGRFTTLSIYKDRFSDTDPATIAEYFSKRLFDAPEYNKFISWGRYWPKYESVRGPGRKRGAVSKEALFAITEYIRDCDKMGLGLSIRMGEEVFNYRFDFRFRSATIYRVSRDFWGNKRSEEVGRASIMGSWEWEGQLISVDRAGD